MSRTLKHKRTATILKGYLIFFEKKYPIVALILGVTLQGPFPPNENRRKHEKDQRKNDKHQIKFLLQLLLDQG